MKRMEIPALILGAILWTMILVGVGIGILILIPISLILVLVRVQIRLPFRGSADTTI